MLTGIELFQHRFSGNPENPCFFLKSVKLNGFQVPRFRTIFGDISPKIFASSCSWQKIRFQKTEYTWGKFCAEGAIFLRLTYDLNRRPRAAVLEDKPAQPLPCGSYLVSDINEEKRKWPSRKKVRKFRVKSFLKFRHFTSISLAFCYFEGDIRYIQSPSKYKGNTSKMTKFENTFHSKFSNFFSRRSFFSPHLCQR